MWEFLEKPAPPIDIRHEEALKRLERFDYKSDRVFRVPLKMAGPPPKEEIPVAVSGRKLKRESLGVTTEPRKTGRVITLPPCVRERGHHLTFNGHNATGKLKMVCAHCKRTRIANAKENERYEAAKAAREERKRLRP